MSVDRQIPAGIKKVADEVRQHGRAAMGKNLTVIAHPGGYTFQLSRDHLVSIVTPVDDVGIVLNWGWARFAAGDTPTAQPAEADDDWVGLG